MLRQIFFLLLVNPIQSPRATQGRGLLSETVLRQKEEVPIMGTCRIDIGSP